MCLVRGSDRLTQFSQLDTPLRVRNIFQHMRAKCTFFTAMVAMFFMNPGFVRAGNLLNPKGWVYALGTVTFTANSLTIESSNYALIGAGNNFTTVPGDTYIVQFSIKGVNVNPANTNFSVYVTGTVGSYSNVVAVYQPSVTTASTAQTFAFTADSTKTQLEFSLGTYVESSVVITAPSVNLGSFTKPGKYTGSITITRTLPSGDISTSSTETAVARVTAEGGFSILTAPNGWFINGGFVGGSRIFLQSGDFTDSDPSLIPVTDTSVLPYTLNGDVLRFSISATNSESLVDFDYTPEDSYLAFDPVTTTAAFSLQWVSN